MLIFGCISLSNNYAKANELHKSCCPGLSHDSENAKILISGMPGLIATTDSNPPPTHTHTAQKLCLNNLELRCNSLIEFFQALGLTSIIAINK